MEEIEIKLKLEEGAKSPVYMTDGAAGMDVFSFLKEEIVLKELERSLIPTGVKMEIPYGYEVQVRPRSGLALKHGISLVNSPGTIDSDYRGEIGIIMINLSKETYIIKNYDRIAQLVLKKVRKAKLLKVDKLSESNRSNGGFGHTGKN